MKYFVALFLGIFFVMCSLESSSAQILNASFEDELPSGNGIQHWGSTALIPIQVDSANIDSALYFRNADPHTGSHALELRNGYSDNVKFGGSVVLLEDDSSYGGFATGMPYKQLPKYFTFYYKFFPASTEDTARATVSIINSVDADIQGTAEIRISQPASEYTQAVVPIHYTGTGEPTNLFIAFASYTAHSTPTFGSRFIVDDVDLRNSIETVHSQGNDPFAVNCSLDALTHTVIFRTDKENTNTFYLSIFSIDGKLLSQCGFQSSVSLNSRNYSSGTYLYTITSNNNESASGKFMIQ